MDDEDAFLTIDGQVGEPLMKNDRMECRISEQSLHLIRPPKTMFFDVLRQKLKWGEALTILRVEIFWRE